MFYDSHAKQSRDTSRRQEVDFEWAAELCAEINAD